MPTEAEYAILMRGYSDPIMGREFNTKADIRRLVSLAGQSLRRARDMATKEISLRWKVEFARIKEENDVWQKALDSAFRREMQMISERAMDMEVGPEK